jgi:3-deoxy-D-manno-octulosonic-acid transferase
MTNGYDIAWGTILTLGAPVWLLHPRLRTKVRRALSERMARSVSRAGTAPAVMIHAVSLGEINATRALVRMLSDARPDLQFIVTTTTDTGFARGRELYGSDPKVTLARYPLDFSGAISRLLDNLRPDLVVLMELEVWPNFLLHCRRRGIPVLLVNGRLTESSYRNYRLGGPLVARMFRRLAAVCAQDQACADRFVALGAPSDRVRVTGTMKFDNAPVTDRIDGADELARLVGLRPGEEPIWVCGSTGPGEEQVILDCYDRMDPQIRLVLVPRHPERFDEVEDFIRQNVLNVVRRSEPPTPDGFAKLRELDTPPVILVDTTGELRKFYSVADVVFVGRTLLDQGPRQRGSDMIEPAALGKPVIVGPWTHNFADAMTRFQAADAIKVVHDATELERAVTEVLNSPDRAAAMGARARDVVRREQGATGRHVEVILDHLSRRAPGVS